MLPSVGMLLHAGALPRRQVFPHIGEGAPVSVERRFKTPQMGLYVLKRVLGDLALHSIHRNKPQAPKAAARTVSNPAEKKHQTERGIDLLLSAQGTRPNGNDEIELFSRFKASVSKVLASSRNWLVPVFRES
nr:hypothetical protein [Salinibacter sp.]